MARTVPTFISVGRLQHFEPAASVAELTRGPTTGESGKGQKRELRRWVWQGATNERPLSPHRPSKSTPAAEFGFGPLPDVLRFPRMARLLTC